MSIKTKAEIVSPSVLSKVSRPQIWYIEQEKDRESRRQASETQQEKGRQRSRARDKKEGKKGDIFLLEEQHENFVAAVTKREMLAATNAK